MAPAIWTMILILALAGASCTADKAKEVFETAQLEERQNNQAHAKELYQEILSKYPKSEYAKKAEERLKAIREGR